MMMKDSVTALYEDLMAQVSFAPLGQVFSGVLRLARRIGDNDLEKWARLELEGYFVENPVFTEDDQVPTYRRINVQHLDAFGRRLEVSPDWNFVNVLPLPSGVAELEGYLKEGGTITVRDLERYGILRDKLGIQVDSTQFSSVAVEKVLSKLRVQLLDRLDSLRPTIEAQPIQSDPKPRFGSVTWMDSWTPQVKQGVITGSVAILVGVMAFLRTDRSQGASQPAQSPPALPTRLSTALPLGTSTATVPVPTPTV